MLSGGKGCYIQSPLSVTVTLTNHGPMHIEEVRQHLSPSALLYDIAASCRHQVRPLPSQLLSYRQNGGKMVAEQQRQAVIRSSCNTFE